MGKTKGRSLRLRNSKKRSKKNYEKNYRKNYKKRSIKKYKKNSKKYRKRSRKTKRSLRGVKRSMRMKGGMYSSEEGEVEVDPAQSVNGVLRDCGIPKIYWARIRGAFLLGPGVETTLATAPIVLKQLDGQNGGGIWESVELRVGQDVKVWSRTAKALVYGQVKEVNDDGKVTVIYKIKLEDVEKNKRRITTKSINDMMNLRWRFRGGLGEILYPRIEVKYKGVKYLYDIVNKELCNLDDADVVADADYKGGKLTNVKWREGKKENHESNPDYEKEESGGGGELGAETSAPEGQSGHDGIDVNDDGAGRRPFI